MRAGATARHRTALLPDAADPARATSASIRRPRRGLAVRAVGLAGELLLTGGVLLALFVVWQVWWTDVVAAREQRATVTAMEDSYTVPEVLEPARARTEEPPPEVRAVSEGEPFATLHVPRWGRDYEVPITEGVGTDVLDTGAAGHYPDTALPGEIGNFALAAHRQTYGAAFRYVDTLEVGDPLIVETADAWLVYRVREDYIVEPDKVEVLAPTPNQPDVPATERLITFTTCHPLWSTAQRWITHGVFERWIPRSEGVPAELLQDG
ncbi:class E sortase [Georgenia sp. M64]|uniref:class E sortase n=1 Tax=Georgenia sp. M64 TaxID=3120520 RepID=UPI0030DF87BE